MRTKLFFVMIIFLVSVSAFAQTPAPTVAPVPVNTQETAPTVSPSPSPSVDLSSPFQKKNTMRQPGSSLNETHLNLTPPSFNNDDAKKTESQNKLNYDPDKQKPDPCEITLTIEGGVNSSYDGNIIVGRYYNGLVGNLNKRLDFCSNKKTSYFFNNWAQVSLTKKPPNYGTEDDVSAGLCRKIGESGSVCGEGGVYFLQGGQVNFVSVTFGDQPEFVDDTMTLGWENTTAYYSPGKNLGLKSGWANKTSLIFTKEFEDRGLSLSLSPSWTFDNNAMYDIGSKSFSSSFTFDGQISKQINKNFSIFAGVKFGKNWFGRPHNETFISGVVGFNYTIRLR